MRDGQHLFSTAGHNGDMALFKRTRIDPSLNEGLDAALGGRAEVLAQATGEGVVLVGTREALALRRDGQWQVWPWEDVSGGGWKSETGTFRWKSIEGEKFSAQLAEPNQLPGLFRERVEASTVVQCLIDSPVRGEVQIICRRALGPDPRLRWYAVPSGGADLADPATAAAVVAETDRLKEEYFPEG